MNSQLRAATVDTLTKYPIDWMRHAAKSLAYLGRAQANDPNMAGVERVEVLYGHKARSKATSLLWACCTCCHALPMTSRCGSSPLCTRLPSGSLPGKYRLAESFVHNGHSCRTRHLIDR